MRLPFVLAMAARESRASRRQIGLYAGAVTLGVAAVVAITAFRADVASAIHEQSRGLLGADVELRKSQPFPTEVRALLDSAAQAGTPIGYVTGFSSMTLAPRSGRSRLVEVRAIEGGFPFYGTVETSPAGSWERLGATRHALVDPSLLTQLAIGLGDTIRIGDAAFPIVGVVTRMPGEIEILATIAPRVYFSAAYVAETGLLRFGSRVRYAAYVKLDNRADADRFISDHETALERGQVRHATAEHREEELAESVDILSRFLGLIGLVALLLGGVATASAVHVYVKRKLDTVAVLRCLGATPRTVLAVYLLQATVMGLVGSIAGVVLGLVVQRALPPLLADFLPLEVRPGVRLPAVLAGLGIGTWVAVAFGLLPLLGVRDVPPLQALRHAYEPVGRRLDGPRVLAYAALACTVLALSVSQAPWKLAGLGFAVAISLATLVLWVTALGLMRLTRRFFPHWAPYVVRQGIANLYRPHNQTVPVMLTVGFGVLLLGTLHVVERNLLDQLALEVGGSRPNLAIFDVQTDQVAGSREILEQRGRLTAAATPIVPARIAALNGRSIDELLRDSARVRPARWALRREYRNTYRDTAAMSEELLAGKWWEPGRPRAAALPRISIEESVAEELGVGVGDRITWDVQGVQIETAVTSVRRVDWTRFEPNFFVVFEPGVLEDAPQSYVLVARIADPARRAEAQSEIVRRFPNVSALDLSLVLETVETVMRSVSVAIRFMALFSIACGVVVLLGAVATSRYQRLRESVLLKTLGARTSQVVWVLATEYCALGVLAALTGIVLASAAGWVAVRFLFELPFALPVAPLVALAAGAGALTTLLGLAGSRDLARRPPLAVLREIAE